MDKASSQIFAPWLGTQGLMYGMSSPLFQPDILFHYINGPHPLFLKSISTLCSNDFSGASVHMKMFLALVKTGVVSQDQDTPIPALAPEISMRSKGRQLLLYGNTSLLKPVYCMSILLCVLHCSTCLRCPHFYSLPFQIHVSFKATSYMKPPRSL